MVAVIGQSLLLAVSILYFDIVIPALEIGLLLFIELFFVIYVFWEIGRTTLTNLQPTIKTLLHIIFDSLILSGLIYYTGGASNPFIYLLLLSVALGSFMLPAKPLVVLVAIELILYSALNTYERPLAMGEDSTLTSFHLHLAGMWVNFILTVILLAVFGLITRSSLLKQEKKLQHLREKDLQDEQILGLGIMAANAAHELGTPLSTMSIVIDDIQHANISDEQQQDMKLLQDQINRCRKIISRLNDKSQHAQQQLSSQVQDKSKTNEQIHNFKQQLERLIERWLVYQPKITLIKNFDKSIETINYTITISLEQAITNLLDNAAEASLDNKKQTVYLESHFSKQNIVIDIKDNGTGIANLDKSYVGKRIQPSNKQDGLGWGMFLSNVSIERVAGSVLISDYKNESESGSLTRITLPKGQSNAD